MPKKNRALLDDLKDFRERLGPAANDYTPSELRRLRDDMRVMAEVIIEFLLVQNTEPQDKTISY